MYNNVATIFSGSSVPSGFVLWVMRELPSRLVKQEVETIAFVSENTRVIDPPSPNWTTATSMQNQVKMHIHIYDAHSRLFGDVHVELFDMIHTLE